VFVYCKEGALQRGDHSFGGVLLSLVCLHACNPEASNKRGGLGPRWALVPRKKKYLTYPLTYVLTYLIFYLLARSLPLLLACSLACSHARSLSLSLSCSLALSLSLLLACLLARSLDPGRTDFSKRQTLPRLLRKSYAFCRTRKYICMYAVLRNFSLNAVHTLQSNSFEISFNTLPSKPAFFMWSISMRLFPPKFCMHLYAARHVTYFSLIRVLGFINCIIFGEMHVSQSSSVCNFLKLKILYLHGAAGINLSCSYLKLSRISLNFIFCTKHINCNTYSVL
jgi:hypothetical protein